MVAKLTKSCSHLAKKGGPFPSFKFFAIKPRRTLSKTSNADGRMGRRRRRKKKRDLNQTDRERGKKRRRRRSLLHTHTHTSENAWGVSQTHMSQRNISNMRKRNNLLQKKRPNEMYFFLTLFMPEVETVLTFFYVFVWILVFLSTKSLPFFFVSPPCTFLRSHQRATALC